jgi:Zn-dependent metalloprotease
MKIQNITPALISKVFRVRSALYVFSVLSISMLCSTETFGQSRNTAESDPNQDGIVMNQQLRNLITAEGESGYMYFREDLKLDASDLFTTHKVAFGLSAKDAMTVRSSETCNLGMVHQTYEHFHNGYRVIESQYITHEKDGILLKGNGRLATGLNLNSVPTISEATALQIALADIGATKYTWEDPAMEQWIKADKNDPNASFYPTGELVYYTPLGAVYGKNYRLAYYFLINYATPFGSDHVYVDAVNGTILERYSALKYTNYTGSANTRYSGTRSITTSRTAPPASNYILHDQSRGNGIHVWDARFGTSQAASVEFVDADNVWTDTSRARQPGTDALWAGEMTYDYFKAVHGWNSFTGTDKLIKIYLNWESDTFVNAFYSPANDIFAFGIGDPRVNIQPYATMDVVGHELGHGVVQYAVAGGTGIPSYRNEPGAIDEAFADIWGTCIEFWGRPEKSNWLNAEDNHTAPPYYGRSLAAPKSVAPPQPTTYLQDTARTFNWKWTRGYFDYLLGNPNWDNGGVHHNNTVGTHWFYMLTVGKSGTNDKGKKYTVEGVGLQLAEKVAYRAMQYHLGSAPQWADLRAATIEAAKELSTTPKALDPCANLVRQVINAWYAVGVGDPLLMFEDVVLTETGCEDSTGTAEAKVKGVTGTPKYEWSNGDTTALADSLYAGDWTVTVTDTSTGCTIDTTITIEENVNFKMDIGKKDPTECKKSDGWAEVRLTDINGTPQIIWSNGGTTERITDLPAGEYCVTVTDTHTMCEKDTCIELEEWEPRVVISGGGNRTYCKGKPRPPVTLSAQAYIGDAHCLSCTYLWSTGAAGKSITVNNPGSYSVTATVFTDCQGSASTSVIYWERDCDDPDEPEWEIPTVGSLDPNDITGPQGYGPERFIAKESTMEYRIRYENDPDFATAPALKVIITMPFHSNAQMFSFKLGNFGFGDFVFNVPENTTFYTNRLDVSDSLGVLLDVTAGINVATSNAFWIFNSIDPLTGLEPTDASLGYLPVNDSITHRGEGFVSFTMSPKPTLTTGDTISESAIIIFDINDEIPTNTWLNTIDAIAPWSEVDSLRTHSDSTTIRIPMNSGDDIGGSGVGSFKLYYSADGGPWTFYSETPADTGIYFSGLAEVTYGFFTLAVDNVGNTEAMKDQAETTTTLHETPLSFWMLSGDINYQNTALTRLQGVTIELVDTGNVAAYTAVTNAIGHYSWPEVLQGEYAMWVDYRAPWGGGNAVDALLVARHFTGMEDLTAVPLGAADVNATGFVNSMDAQLIATRFVDMIDSFPSGDWYFHKDRNIMLSSDSVLDIPALCFGDVNGSFIPGTKGQAASVFLQTGATSEVFEGMELDIPIMLTRDLELGSVSLSLNYPSGLQIIGVRMQGVNEHNLFWRHGNGMLRLAWFDPSGRMFKSGEALITLRVKVDGLSSAKDLGFSIDAESQLSDTRGKVYDHEILELPKLEVNNLAATTILGNYPNPFSDQTEVRFSLPEKALVSIKVFNAKGEEVAILADQRLEAGEHTSVFNSEGMASGVYLIKLDAIAGKKEVSVSHRMVLTRN